jgi:hypothetical protein
MLGKPPPGHALKLAVAYLIAHADLLDLCKPPPTGTGFKGHIGILPNQPHNTDTFRWFL